jgi:peptidoglycan/LPS O-acetylase OafA/YrhL
MTAVTTPPADRLPQLDGLRGAAILFVVWHHFGLHLPGWLDIGPIAPNMFFLLSGYLITRSILKRGMGPARMASYHARRFARLLPALYVMLLVGWLAGLEEFRGGLGWHAGFATNFKMVADNDWSGSLSHLWSLAVQEQFYLLWPFVLFLPARLLPGAFLTLIAGAAVFRAGCLHAGTTDFFRWFLLPASMDAFAAGALVAWLMIRHHDQRLISPRWMIPAAGLAAACWVVGRRLRYLEGTGHVALALVDVFETVTLTFLLVVLLQNLSAPIVRLFSFKPLVGIGRVSYGVYVWHMLVAYAFGPLLDRAGVTVQSHDLIRCLILTFASVGVAGLSWIALEKPFIDWVRRVSEPGGLWQGLRGRLAKFFAGAGLS